MNEKNERTALKRPSSLGLVNGVGKIPPQDLELEKLVLGAMLSSKYAVEKVILLLKPAAFYNELHGEIFNVMNEMYSHRYPIDIQTVSDNLKKGGKLEMIGGKQAIADLTMMVSNTANIEEYAKQLVEYAIKRNVIHTCNTLIGKAYDDTFDAFELVEESEHAILNVNDFESGVKHYYTGVEVGLETVKEIQAKKDNKSVLTGIPSGFISLDRITHGWRNGHLIIIAARPAMGKTAAVLSMLESAVVHHKRRGAIISLEMTRGELMNRLYSINTGIEGERIDRGTLNDVEWKMVTNSKVAHQNLFIDDTPALSLTAVRAKARRLKDRENIDFLIIDYLQLMRFEGKGSGSNREQEIANISRGLKSLAKELNIPIIALSQLSRAVEARPDKRPMLSDLRESGSIEQDADIVMFLYRPEYYKITQLEDGTPTLGIAEWIIAKHRGGKTDTVITKFIGRLTKFQDFNDLIETHPNWIEDSKSKMNPEEEAGSNNGTGDDTPF